MVKLLTKKGKFMKKTQTADIKKSINICKMKLNTIINYLSDNKPILNEKYNQILIEKAILIDKLKKNKTPFFIKLAKKIRPKHNRELICDYFQINKRNLKNV